MRIQWDVLSVPLPAKVASITTAAAPEAETLPIALLQLIR